MNQRGQALIETAVVVLLVLFLFTILLRASYMAWANLIVDRENHRLAICTLRTREPLRCQKISRAQLPKLLFGFAEIQRVKSHITQEAAGYYSVQSQIYAATKFGSVTSARSIGEEEILRASRRWRW